MEEKKTSGLGVASLVLGIIGMLLSCLFVGILPCIIGLILAIVGIANKKVKHGTCIAGLVCSVIGIGIFLITMFFMGSLSSTDDTVSVTSSSGSDISTTITKETTDFSDSDFKTNGYLYENGIGDTLYFVSIKNNSKHTIRVNGNATAYDKNKNAIGADSSDLHALGAGEEQILYFYFSSVTGVEDVEYTFNYEKDNTFNSAIPYLEIKETINEENVVVTVTNNGDKSARFVEAYALFFDGNGNLVDYSSTYIVDDDSEIKYGDTISEQITSYNDFETVKMFYSGRY